MLTLKMEESSSDEDFTVGSNEVNSESGDDELSNVGSSEADDLRDDDMSQNAEDEEDDDDTSYEVERADDEVDDAIVDESHSIIQQNARYWGRDQEDAEMDIEYSDSLPIVRLDPESGKTSIVIKLSREEPTPPSDDELIEIFGDSTLKIDEITLDGTSLNRRREGEGGWILSRRVVDALALLISRSVYLKTIDLHFVEFESIRPINRSLRENRSIRNIRLSDMDCRGLWRGLEQMAMLESLDISDFPLHGQAIQNLLINTKALDRLYILGNAHGQRAILPFLCHGIENNETLTLLSLQRGNLDEDGATILAKALTVNTKLSNLILGLNRAGASRKNVLRAIGQHLPNMRGLDSLSIENDNFDLHNLIVFMLGLEDNKSLTKCSMATLSFLNPQSPMLALINFYMDLNRAHRGDLLGQVNIPLPLWPHILAKTSFHGLSVLFHFVREEPAVFKREVLFSP